MGLQHHAASGSATQSLCCTGVVLLCEARKEEHKELGLALGELKWWRGWDLTIERGVEAAL